MGTFLEILFTTAITVGIGILFLKFGPVPRHKRKRATLYKNVSSKTAITHTKQAHQRFSGKFAGVLLLITIFFTAVGFLAAKGIIILTW